MKYPNASCFLDAQGFIYWSLQYSAKEIGEDVVKICTDLVSGDFVGLERYPFIFTTSRGSLKRRAIPPSVRKKVLSCGECGFCGAIENLCVDHIIPVCKSGTNDIDNLQCLCSSCNSKKAGKIL